MTRERLVARPSHVLLRILAIALALVGLSAVFAPRAAHAASGDTQPMYRLYNPNSGEHFYTASYNERQHLRSVGWRYEGIGWMAPKSGSPVYRLYSGTDHHYTLSTKERDHLISVGWRYEGEAWKSGGSVPLLRQFNPNVQPWAPRNNSGSHNYTTSTKERANLVRLGWRDEGIGWYAVAAGPSESQGTPYATHGRLKVDGTDLLDKNDAPFQLRGVSTHGLAWFPQYVSKDAFVTLRDWGANCVRLALYTDEYGGYCSGGNQSQLKDLVRKGVRAATDAGMYVIIDWHVLHDLTPTKYESQAKSFFSSMSAEFKNQDNVLYEICNEPNGGTTWSTVKGYAERIIPVIRANDPDAIVIVGSPEWSQRIDQAAANRIGGSNGRNVLYSLHFYAATHGQWLRDRLSQALNSGLPVIISEFGTCDASGGGGNDFGSATAWLDLAQSRNVGWCCWSLCNKAETASLVGSWCGKTSGWGPGDLTDAGRFIRNRLIAQS